jgi:hypothetical protein
LFGKENDVVAAGFLIFAIGEGVMLPDGAEGSKSLVVTELDQELASCRKVSIAKLLMRSDRAEIHADHPDRSKDAISRGR